MEIIEQQSQQIAKLTKLRDYQEGKINENNAIFERAVAKFDREILRQKMLLRKKRELVAERKQTILEEYERQSSIVHEEADNALNDIENRNKTKTDVLQRKVNPAVNKIIKKVNDLNDNSTSIHKKLDDANGWIQTNRATLAAKIVHDQVRFNQFLRDMSTRFDAFKTDEKIWDLDANQVEEAEKVVIEMEKKIAKKCPINVKQQMQASADAAKAMDLLSGNNLV